MNAFYIDVPSAIEDEDELVDWIRENVQKFVPAMDLDASIYGERATVHGDPEITNVEVKDNRVSISYVFHWEEYNGCSDINRSGNSADCITGELEDYLLVFEESSPKEKRSPNDEL